MDKILSDNLPPELCDKIAKLVHNSYMKQLSIEIQMNVVWIRIAGGGYSFLVGKTQNNPYYVLHYTTINIIEI